MYDSLFAKDGYEFEYCDDKENRQMRATYNKILKSIHKLKLLKSSTEKKLDFLGTVTAENPLYLFSPKTQEDIDSLISLDGMYFSMFGRYNLKPGNKYILRFSDEIGDFSVTIFSEKEVLDDIQNFINLKEEIENV